LQKRNSRSGWLFHIDGVGVDLARFHTAAPEEKERLRRQYGFSRDDFILLYIAEFIPRKNHGYLIRRIPLLREVIPELRVVFAGKGETLEACKKNVNDLNAADIVRFLGYRQDVDALYRLGDVYVSVSRQEGLPISCVEAMACGLPLVLSKIRGHLDIVTEGRNGFLVGLDDAGTLTERIITLRRSPLLCETIAAYNAEDAQRFSLDRAIDQMANIYRQFM
jgi:glycosyltransferase EpsD